jgi:F0F1-type ATP synthase membrane subunit b/b'
LGVLSFIVLSFIYLIPEWVNTWFNYPGLEAWKFINLAIFIVVAIVLHRRFGKPLRRKFEERSEAIKQELLTAQKERDEARARLAEIETRFQKLDAEVLAIQAKAKSEAENERARLQAEGEAEVAKIRDQARREIESAGKAARLELRRFAAAESVQLAEEVLRREIRPDDDARITAMNVQEFGRTGA